MTSGASPRRDGRSRRIALVLEYDGSGYGGSQLQSNAPSIQGELEKALQQFTGEQLRATFAGRTDAGVHARGQVAAINTTSALETNTFVQGLNAWLPDDIAVRHATDVDKRFNPRRDAAHRTYRYTIYNAQVRSPLWHSRAWRFPQPLDVPMMQRAADALVGTHDFAAFSRREGVPTVRCVSRCRVERDGALVTVEMQANAFLRQQVRRTAGALAQVGAGLLSLHNFRAMLKRAEPCTAEPVAPPHGLCLVEVAYPGLDLTGADAL